MLRATDGKVGRINSVLAVGDPGMAFSDAVERVVAFASEHSIPPLAHAVVGGDVLPQFEAAGWVPARPHEADTCFQVASVSRLLRTLREDGAADTPEGLVEVLDVSDEARSTTALVDPRTTVHRASVVVDDGSEVARGTLAVTGDWACLRDLYVADSHRRHGVARSVIEAILERAAEQGATTAYLQVRGDNPAAMALYDRLGFAIHHTYRYLRPG